MAKKGFTAEQIINKLREAEIHLSQGETVAVISRKIGVSAYTYYRWRKEYNGIVTETWFPHIRLKSDISKRGLRKCSSSPMTLF